MIPLDQPSTITVTTNAEKRSPVGQPGLSLWRGFPLAALVPKAHSAIKLHAHAKAPGIPESRLIPGLATSRATVKKLVVVNSRQWERMPPDG